MGLGLFFPSLISTINLSRLIGIFFFNSGTVSIPIFKFSLSFNVFVFFFKLFMFELVLILVIFSSFDFESFFSFNVFEDLKSIFDKFILSVKNVPPSYGIVFFKVFFSLKVSGYKILSKKLLFKDVSVFLGFGGSSFFESINSKK